MSAQEIEVKERKQGEEPPDEYTPGLRVVDVHECLPGIMVEMVQEISPTLFMATGPGVLPLHKNPEEEMIENMMNTMVKKMREATSPPSSKTLGISSNVYMTKEEYESAGRPVPGDYVTVTLQKVKRPTDA